MDIRISPGLEAEEQQDDAEIEMEYALKATAGQMLDRLNALGRSDQHMLADYLNYRAEKIDDLQYDLQSDFAFNRDLTLKQLSFWKRCKATDFIRGVERLIQAKSQKEKEIKHENIYNSIHNYLHSQPYDLINILPFNDDLYSIRAILCAVPRDTIITQEYTDLYHGGWVGDTDVIATETGDKIIILTEGSSDIAFLKPALKLLYPHLEDFYSFFDFESFNAQGGSGSLVNMIKSFAGAGVSNKIIALFDNDTAAREAQTILKDVSLPGHIKVMNYPYLKLAENYPTLGPTGLNNMNINGLACSIELYAGEDVLRDRDDTYFPIFWKGYSAKIQAYQGEILSKKEVQVKFSRKLVKCMEEDAYHQSADWEGMIAVFEQVFNAFNHEQCAYEPSNKHV